MRNPPLPATVPGHAGPCQTYDPQRACTADVHQPGPPAPPSTTSPSRGCHRYKHVLPTVQHRPANTPAAEAAGCYVCTGEIGILASRGNAPRVGSSAVARSARHTSSGRWQAVRQSSRRNKKHGPHLTNTGCRPGRDYGGGFCCAGQHAGVRAFVRARPADQLWRLHGLRLCSRGPVAAVLPPGSRRHATARAPRPTGPRPHRTHRKQRADTRHAAPPVASLAAMRLPTHTPSAASSTAAAAASRLTAFRIFE